jgi:RNA polymerase sigma-70 factor (ECF subfamily)
MSLAFRVHASQREGPQTSVNPTDEQLVAAGTGDTAVFAQLYDRYVDGIYRYCRLRLPSDVEAEDATAMVFEKAFAAFPPAPTGTFRAWLFTIAHNVVVSYYRTRSRRGHHHSLDDALHVADPGTTPEEDVLLADEPRRLYLALARLPEDQRRVIELRLAGLLGAEIAEVLHRSPTAVRQLQFRAMRRLRELLIDSQSPATKEGHDADLQ